MIDRDHEQHAERDLQQYLNGGSLLSTRYREQSRETPPPQLDAAVLAHAQAQLQSLSGAPRGRRVRRQHQRWMIPLATAATLGLGVNLAWQLRDQAVPDIAARSPAVMTARVAPQADALEMQAPARADAPAAKAEAFAEESQKKDAARRPAAAPAPVQQALAPSAARDAASAAGAVAAAPVVALEQAPAPAEARSEAAAKRKQAAAEADAMAELEMAPAKRQAATAGVAASRERKAIALGGAVAAYGAPMAPAAAPAPQALAAQAAEPAVPASAQDIAGDLLGWLRAGNYAAIREALDAPTVSADTLRAATKLARTLDADARGVVSTAGDGLWRIDYRDADQVLHCTAMLEQTPDGWSLLSLDLQ